MKSVRRLLQLKGDTVWSVTPDCTVFEALAQMDSRNIGALVVLERGKLVGIFTERDYARKIILRGKHSAHTRIDEIMTREVTSVDPSQGIEQCLPLMTNMHVRYLPVLDGDRVIGVISMGDVVKHIISEQESLIRQLEEQMSERERSQATLRRREAEIRAILEAAVDGIVSIDIEGTILSFNPAAERIFGYTSEEVKGRNVAMLMAEPHRAQHREYISRYLESGEARVIGVGREVLGRRKNGRLFPLYIAVSEVRLEDTIRFAGIVRDLTDFKRMQRKALQAENLAAIGEMAASIAHEIKNPLAGISGAVEVLKETLDPKDQRRAVMEEVVAQVQRLDSTVRQLLRLSASWKPEKHLCDLQELVEKVIRTAKQDAKSFGRVRFVQSGKRKAVAPVDPYLFEQILWNLFQNAVDAMPDGGEIHYGFSQTVDEATVTVEDTGLGLPEGFEDRLFRPFFTTKAVGTGLGLSICKKIMDAHGGSITLSKSRGRGTKATLRFPAGGGASSQDRASSPAKPVEKCGLQ